MKPRTPRRHKTHEMQAFIRLYKEQTGSQAVDMHEVAKDALSKGWRVPPPVSDVDRLSREFARAAREETRFDESTKRPYRANHAYPGLRNGLQTTLWVDIDDAPRGQMLASLTLRRQQMVDDGYHLSLDAEHWNAQNPSDQPINLMFDFRDDIEERKNVPYEGQRAG